jgi:hypothetical protein
MTKQKKQSRAASRSVLTVDTSPKSADMFEYAFAVIDSAATGAILAGMHPASLEPVLAFWFLNVAARARKKSEQVAKVWLTTNVFGSIVDAVAQFARSYDGPRKDRGEAEELLDLIDASAAARPAPRELEAQHQNTQAMRILEWATGIVGQTAAMPAEIVELVLLLEWLKVAAMAPDVDKDIYIVARQSVPVVHRAYEPLLQ